MNLLETLVVIDSTTETVMQFGPANDPDICSQIIKDHKDMDSLVRDHEIKCFTIFHRVTPC